MGYRGRIIAASSRALDDVSPSHCVTAVSSQLPRAALLAFDVQSHHARELGLGIRFVWRKRITRYLKDGASVMAMSL